MRYRSSAALSVALTLLAANAWPAEPNGPAPSVAPAAAAPTAGAPETKPVNSLLEVTIDPNVPTTVCRRYTPTGSRISSQICETNVRLSAAAEQANRDILRRDIEEMRALQMAREQARAQAEAAAMRRRTSGL